MCLKKSVNYVVKHPNYFVLLSATFTHLLHFKFLYFETIKLHNSPFLLDFFDPLSIWAT